MAALAQYTSTPKLDFATVLTADASLTQPTIANTGIVFTAGNLGSRIDNIQISSTVTTAAGQLRLFICKGFPGKTISSITSSSTIATLTTSAAHGLITGDTVTVQGCNPPEFNVKSASITVTSTTAFTYTITAVNGVSATDIGYYSSTRVATSAQYALLREITFSAITQSTSTASYNVQYTSVLTPDLLPIILPAGYSLRTSVSVTQTSPGITVTAIGGDF
jgi:hypothetical protein